MAPEPKRTCFGLAMPLPSVQRLRRVSGYMLGTRVFARNFEDRRLNMEDDEIAATELEESDIENEAPSALSESSIQKPARTARLKAGLEHRRREAIYYLVQVKCFHLFNICIINSFYFRLSSRICIRTH